MAVADLLVKIGADVKNFQEGMNSVSDQVTSIGRKLSGFGDSLTKSLSIPLLGIGGGALAAANKMDEGYDAI